jgi:hypothetical protein
MADRIVYQERKPVITTEREVVVERRTVPKRFTTTRVIREYNDPTSAIIYTEPVVYTEPRVIVNDEPLFGVLGIPRRIVHGVFGD